MTRTRPIGIQPLRLDSNTIIHREWQEIMIRSQQTALTAPPGLIPTRCVALTRGLSLARFSGRLPVDFDVEISRRFPAEVRGLSASPSRNPLVAREHLS